MNGSDDADTAKWDPVFTRQVKNAVGPVVKRYFRAEVNGLGSLPASGGALVVSNHSGGVLTPDVLIFAPAFYDAFGYDRPLYILAHYGVLLGPLGTLLSRVGGIEASRTDFTVSARARAACKPRRREQARGRSQDDGSTLTGLLHGVRS